MKKYLPIPAILVLNAALLVAAGCNKKDRVVTTDDVHTTNTTVVHEPTLAEKTGSVFRDTADKVGDAASSSWDSIKGYSYEKRAEVTPRLEAWGKQFSAKTSELRADYARHQATEAESKALKTLADSEADLADKQAALSRADAEAWESAKADYLAAVKRAEADYAVARANAASAK